MTKAEPDHFMGGKGIRKPGLFQVWLLPFVLCGLLFLLGGCVVQPRMVDVSGAERERIAAAFEKFHARQGECRCCIDVAVTVTLNGLLHAGTVGGYLQAMSPAFLRFTGLNPLGQPLMILVSDGERFLYLAVDRGKGYTGNVEAETFVKYAPSGFRPSESFYWLTARLPAGPMVIEELGREVDGGRYWLTVKTGGERRRLLFDPVSGVIIRHQVLDDAGEDVFDVLYEEFRSVGENGCLLPGRITVTTRQHRGTLVVSLSDWLDDAVLSEKDFSFALPSGFEQVAVP